MYVPDAFDVEFLEWLREATERTWRTVKERTLEDYRRAGVGGVGWRTGTRWSGGLTDSEIDAIEARYDLKFPADHRLLLQTLHCTTPRMAGAAFTDGRIMEPIERPGFYDWLHDEDAIRAALSEPLEGILFDVENEVLWPPSWGPRPPTAAARRARLAELIAAAPRLIPIIGHRYLVSVEPHVVLSVHQADIIVYGRSLRDFLLMELEWLTGVSAANLGEEPDTSRLPFWGELIG